MTNSDRPSPSELPVDPLLGQTLDGRYRIESRLAHGGMGTVYVAEDLRLDRPVALKVIHPHLAENDQLVARFQREARAAARISHPGVVPVYDQGVWRGQAYLVMELIQGETLRHKMLREGAIPVGQALQFTQQMLLAADAAHRVGVIHRDIKPENALVHNGNIRLVDFGLARATGESSATSTVMGTVNYVAPESFGSGVPDDKSDVYAIGIILFEMLTGQLPWSAENLATSGYIHVHEDVPAPSTLVPWLPTSIDSLVTSMCSRLPEERPSAAAAGVDVEKTLNSLPPEILSRHATCDQTEKGHTEVLVWPQVTAIQFEPQLVRTSGSLNQVIPGKSRSRGRIVTLLVLTLILAGAGTATWWWLRYGPGAYQVMPNLQGLSASSAERALTERNLQFEILEDYSDTAILGTVVSTDPEAGARVHRDEFVEVTISLGVEVVPVPVLTGLTVGDAEEALQRAGLELGQVTYAWSDSEPEGTIIAVNPREGRKLPRASTVGVEISRGPQPVEISSVVNLPVEEAKQILTSLGLVVNTTTVNSDTVAAGLVVSQSPTPGSTTAHRGDTVELVVSLGIKQVQVPNVVELPVEQAESELIAVGFEVEISRTFPWFGNNVTVHSQSPEADVWVDAGSTVQLVVGN